MTSAIAAASAATEENPVTEEVAESFGSRFKSLLTKAGKYGASTVRFAGPVLVKGLHALAGSPPPPLNVITAVVEGIVEQTKGNEESN